MTDKDHAQEFITEFLGRLSRGEVAAFHISYVGFGDEQKCSLTGGHEKDEELIALMEEAVAGSKEATRRSIQ